MTKIILDADTRSKLLNLTQPLDLCDEMGRVLGTFMPLVSPAEDDYGEPPISEEELRRRAKGPGYTTEEVIAYLESL
ncbi:MAG TPA: hypothetical protein VMV69_16650 [Pirellulales bacterium]|nr:hypothetical protein [Pirellulales bacterium]